MSYEQDIDKNHAELQRKIEKVVRKARHNSTFRKFIRFIFALPSIWKFYKKYGYDGNTMQSFLRLHNMLLRRVGNETEE